MARRMTRRESWSYFEHVLADNEVAEQGNIACIDLSTGELVAGDEDTGLLPIGYFDRDLEGDGVAKARVRLFGEIQVDRFANDSNDPVTVADIGSMCFIAGPATVSIEGSGRSVAGRVWGVSSDGVLVQMALNLGPEGPQGDPG